jgi:hypothetical protein
LLTIYNLSALISYLLTISMSTSSSQNCTQLSATVTSPSMASMNQTVNIEKILAIQEKIPNDVLLFEIIRYLNSCHLEITGFMETTSKLMDLVN